MIQNMVVRLSIIFRLVFVCGFTIVFVFPLQPYSSVYSRFRGPRNLSFSIVSTGMLFLRFTCVKLVG